MSMTKDQAIQVFGGGGPGVLGLARLLGVTRQAVYRWPTVLPLALADRVVGAAWRSGRLEKLEAVYGPSPAFDERQLGLPLPTERSS